MEENRGEKAMHLPDSKGAGFVGFTRRHAFITVDKK